MLQLLSFTLFFDENNGIVFGIFFCFLENIFCFWTF